MNSQSDIGQKIQYFRKAHGLSQLQLELAIEAAPGSISRIENGKTNPTKETILLISRALGLQPLQVTSLLGITSNQPNKEEVEKIKLYVSEILDSSTAYCYLLDNRSCLVAFSVGFSQFLTSVNAKPDEMIGVNIVEVIFNPAFGIRQSMDPEEFKRVSTSAVIRLKHEMSYIIDNVWWNNLIENLHSFEGFDVAWEYANHVSEDVISPRSRTVVFGFGEKSIKMIYSPIYLNPDPRFSLIEYIPLS